MLTNNGVDAVNLANNHTMDFFEKGYTDTTFNLYCAGITWSDQNTAATYQVGNYKIGMFGICDWDPINLAYQRIEELKTEGCNIIIANCHWGEEAKYEQNDKQTVLAHKLIDKGVDIVVGSHPHRLQPLEKYKDKWIAYSISNFCFGNAVGRHNLSYWQCGEYLGVGPAAHSFLNGRRFFYERDLAGFLAGAAPVDDGPGGGRDEVFLLALRTDSGVCLPEFEQRFSFTLSPAFYKTVELYESHGLVTYTAGRLCLTAQGFLLSNSIISALLAEF